MACMEDDAIGARLTVFREREIDTAPASWWRWSVQHWRARTRVLAWTRAWHPWPSPQRLSRDLSRKVKEQSAAGPATLGQGSCPGGGQTVVLEDPNVWGMVKNHKLARSTATAAWLLLGGCWRPRLSPWPRGEEHQPLGARLPSLLGLWAQGGEEELAVRAWRGSACGTEPHRDVNAARKILAAGLGERLDACGGERWTRVVASGSEAGTHLNQEVRRCTACEKESTP